jgi:putative flippase GtrA
MMKIARIFTGNQIVADGFRFAIAGGLNTLITLLIYQICLAFFSHNMAYAISWLVGILYLIIIYPAKVFPGKSFSLIRSMAVIGIYIAVFVISLWGLGQVINLGMHERLAIFIVLIISSALNFIFVRMVYRGVAS